MNRHAVDNNGLIVHGLRKGAIQLRTAIGYSVTVARYAEITVSIGQAYRTEKHCVALRFNPAGKTAIVFLPQGVILRVIQPSSCVRDGFEVVFGKEVYNVSK